MRLIFIFFVLFVSGCAGSPLHISLLNEEELKRQDSMSLCRAYSIAKSDKIRNELIRRKAIDEEELSLADLKKIRIGMSECGLLASWGGTGTYGDINRSVGPGGERAQWVYRPCRSCGADYVYTENGKIIGWQD